LTLPACSSPFSTIDPAGPAAQSIARLWWVMLAGATVLLFMVVGLSLAAFVAPASLRRTSSGAWLVGGGLVLPAVVLTPLLVYALWDGERLLRSADDATLTVDVVARQWQWEFTYRGDGRDTPIQTINTLHIPADTNVRLNITSADVIHGFWIPRLAGKIDAIPGHVTTLTLRADRPGRYHGLCAEFCGTAHLEMRMDVEAHTPDGYEAALRNLRLILSERQTP
jgi:cytochrome c oxidase subunit II